MQNRGRDMSAPNSISQKSNTTSLYHENELVRHIVAKDEIQRIRLCMQRELELAKKFRIEAEKYQRETESRARSQACMLLLRARLATQKEIITEFKRTASQEIQKEMVAEFKRTADEEMRKEITELVNTANQEITEFVNAANQEIQKETEQFKSKANEEITELISMANQKIQKEIERFKSKVNKEMNEIQKVLTDIRTIRKVADNELKIQRRLADATRITALEPSSK